MKKAISKSSTAHKVPSELEAQLRAATSLADAQIDTTDPDAPEVKDWSGATRGKFYRPLKRQKTLRIDADVLAYFESQGPGYLSRMNAVLRQAMLRALAKRG
jgi:uncharacterized protein (DUF4415 family)